MSVDPTVCYRAESYRYRSATTSRFSNYKKRTLDTETNGVYQHKPLRDPSQCIRLFHLLPRSSSVIISGRESAAGELLSYNVNRAPPYVALSYTWGNANRRRPIAVGNKLFYATETLAVALDHIRDDDKTLIIWIDAICIDQDNETEKSSQVQRMGITFGSAAVVLAWLGPKVKEDGSALRLMRKFGKLKIDMLKAVSISDYEATDLLSVIAFFEKAWFKRVWVRQEISLSQSTIFICGSEDIRYNYVMRTWGLSSAMISSYGPTRSSTAANGTYWTTGFSRVPPLSLSAFLEHRAKSRSLKLSSSLQSSEPRDYVYSLFGMISDTVELGLRVDYSKSVEEVYTDFAKAALRAGGIDGLAKYWDCSEKNPNLPSWVPDWSNLSPSPVGLEGRWDLSGPPAKVLISADGDELLLVQGYRLDQISKREFIFQTENGVEEHFDDVLLSSTQGERLNSFIDQVNADMQSCPLQIPCDKLERQIFLTILCTEMTQYSKTRPDNKTAYSSYCAFRGLKCPPQVTEGPYSAGWDSSGAFLREAQSSTARQYFRTINGYVGLCSIEVLPGDRVYVMRASKFCWILRPGARLGQYQLLGQAHIVGIKYLLFDDRFMEEITIC